MTQIQDSAGPVAAAEPSSSGTSWRDVLRGVVVGDLILAAGFVIVGLLGGSFDPFFVVIAAVLAPGLFLIAKRHGKAGVIYAGVTSVLLLLMALMFGAVNAFAHPESTFTIVLFSGLLFTNVLGVVALPGALRRRSSRVSDAAPKVVGALLALVVVVGVVAGLVAGNDTQRAGDLVVKAEKFKWNDESLEADTGRVAVFIENNEGAHHDFTIDGVVKEELPGFKSRRAEFDVEAGEYRFYCTLHPEDMEGTLNVT